MIYAVRRCLLLLTLCVACCYHSFAQSSIKADDPHIHYMGRVDMAAPGTAVLSWSGTSVTVNFTGSCIKFITRDELGENYFNTILDGKVIGVFHEQSKEQITSTICNLKPGNHTLELFKRTEWTMGKTWFYGFQLSDDGVFLSAPGTKKRKMEFYGNSITCGYAIEDSSGMDRGTSPYENNYLSYAALTARHFDAEYQCIARSGIGVLVSWFPQVMPEMYDLLDATNKQSKWDFTKYRPDVVVINLFQNDSWLVLKPEHPEYKARFGSTPPTPEKIVDAYRSFVKGIRSKYPNAHIICALGNMDATKPGSNWPGYITQAVAGLKDKKIYTHFFPYKNTNGHPNIKEQQAMATDLIAFIDKKIKW